MANRRMFSLDVIDTDKFLDMPVSAQCLYFHLGMRADDDGFIASPKQIMRFTTCTQGDIRILIENGYVIPFESGIVVITHWRQNNYLRCDRYTKTVHTKEFSQLVLENGVYTNGTPYGIPSDIPPDDTDKIRLDKNRLDNKNRRFTPPSLEEVQTYCKERNNSVNAESFIDFYESKGWMIGKNKMKDWKAAVRNWEKKETGSSQQKPVQTKFHNFDQREYEKGTFDELFINN